MKNIPIAVLLAFAVTACGDTNDYDRNDRLPDDVVDTNVSEPRDEQVQQEEEDEPLAWNEEWEEQGPWQANEGDLTVTSIAFAGEVGSYLFNDNEARTSGYFYDESSGWQMTSIDTRTTVVGNEAVMVLLNIEGDLLSDQLKNGAVFTWDDWGNSGVYVDAIGCSGDEGQWQDFDAPADEVEIQVTEDPVEPGVATVQYVARWQSWNDPGLVTEAKGVAIVTLP
jgi:hypothetical protein